MLNRRFKIPSNVLKSMYLIGMCMSLGFMAVSTSSAGTLVFEDTFENDPAGKPPNSNHKRKLSHWGDCSGNCGEITTEQARKGKKSLKTYLNRNTSRVSYRTEAVPRGPARDLGHKGVDYWYGFSTLIPNSHLPDALSGDTIAQWHTRSGHPVTVRLDGTELVLIVRDENRNKSKAYRLGQYTTGSWTDWVFHAVWSANDDGLLEVWRNGKKVVTHRGANAKDEPGSPWIKIGLYKTVWRTTSNSKFDTNITSRTFYHDEMRIAVGANAAYADVDPAQSGGGGDVLPPPTNLRIITQK